MIFAILGLTRMGPLKTGMIADEARTHLRVAPTNAPDSNPTEPFAPLASDTWGAVDALGRSLPDSSECGLPPTGTSNRDRRFVGIFYFLTHLAPNSNPIYDNTQIIGKHPNHPNFGPPYSEHWWGKPEFGYYRNDDPWVIRKHLQMLEVAGVDTLVFDVTNGPTYPQAYRAIFKVMEQMRAEGLHPPKFMFITHAHTLAVVNKLWQNIYRDGNWKNQWFLWDGKPIILANPAKLTPQFRQFFTIRRSWAWSNPNGWFGDGHDRWAWLDNTPQAFGWHKNSKVAEEMPVGVAQHPTSNIGRDFHNGTEPPPSMQHPERGIYFQDQWNRAIATKPEFVFVTGWNEWTATAFPHKNGVNFLGQPQKPGDLFFVDEFDEEYNRDCEPERGKLKDDTYYQLVANIRRYKGVRPVPVGSGAKTIRFNGDWSQWNSVLPVYHDAIGDTVHRNWNGDGDNLHYVNNTGRNDFVTMKVAEDAKNLYFYVQTASPITAPTGGLWMSLMLRLGIKNSWEGYNFIVNRDGRHRRSGVLERSTGGWHWRAVGKVSMRIAGNRMALVISRKLLGLSESRNLNFGFKWLDNVRPNDISSFDTDGDVAPDSRFYYTYHQK